MDSNPISISIPKERLHELDQVTFHGKITIVDSLDKVQPAVEDLSSHEVVGFDTETKPTFKKGRSNPVALMQISTRDHGYLFRLNKIGFPDNLRHFIENESVKKIGLSLKDDFFVMHRNSEFSPEGFIELQTLVRDYNIIDRSLQRVYAILFDRRISKGQRLSNWEAPELSDAQQQYAVIDAWACLAIYEHLTAGKFDPSTSPYIVPQNIEAE